MDYLNPFLRPAVLVLSLFALSGFAACDSDSRSGSPERGRIRVDDQSLNVRFLLTNRDRMRGVVRFPRISEGEGVLFVYPGTMPNLYWANRTLLEQELDVAFIGPDGTVLRVDELKPGTGRTVEAGQPAQFILLTPGGWFRRHGISAQANVHVPKSPINAAEPVYSIPDQKTISVDGVSVRVEVARTPYERETGLMHRKALPENQGMLFVFGKTERRHFHMKNTLIPLDIAFLAPSGTIREIKHMEPLNEATTSSDQPAKFVLEMRRGWFREHGIAEGRKFDLSSIRTGPDQGGGPGK